ncbi:MAG: class I SAM-dependent methyltransferase [Alphaproteobacteria bacterium]|nr:class I SAM-dependent methyltransferase [Alphaproteobacteria bacterium]
MSDQPSSWHFFGGPGSIFYGFFDWLRSGLNRRLTRYLCDRCLGTSPKEKLILEAGCGPAFATSLLSERSDVYAVAMDLDINALKEAQKRDPALPAVVGDLRQMPFKDSIFDLVWNSSTVEHLDAPEPAVSEMCRLAKSGGFVFIGVPSATGPLFFQRYIASTRTGIWIGTVFSKPQLEELTRRCGLTPFAVIHYFFQVFVAVLARKA